MLSKYTILDLEINEFSLEDIFLHYYEGETWMDFIDSELLIKYLRTIRK
jgi:hypothetical protein